MDRFAELLAHLGFQVVDLPAGSWSVEEIIRFLVAHLVTVGRLQAEHTEDAVQRVLAREQLGPTAIGHGVALPHATTSTVTGVIGVGTRSAGVSWGPTGANVQRICLILAAPDRPGDYLRVLEALAQGLRPRN